MKTFRIKLFALIAMATTLPAFAQMVVVDPMQAAIDHYSRLAAGIHLCAFVLAFVALCSLISSLDRKVHLPGTLIFLSVVVRGFGFVASWQAAGNLAHYPAFVLDAVKGAFGFSLLVDTPYFATLALAIALSVQWHRRAAHNALYARSL